MKGYNKDLMMRIITGDKKFIQKMENELMEDIRVRLDP